MPEQTPVESGPLVMDALSIARAMNRPSEAARPAPLPEPTQAETPVAAAPTETQEPVASPTPVAPAAGESNQALAEGAPAPVVTEARTSEASEPNSADRKRGVNDWRVDGFYKVSDEKRALEKKIAELEAKLAPPATTPTQPQPPAAQPSFAVADEPLPVFDPEKYPGGYDEFVVDLAVRSGAKEARRIAAENTASDQRKLVAQGEQQVIDRYKRAVADSGIADYQKTIDNSPVKFQAPHSHQMLNELVVFAPEIAPKILHFLATNPNEVVRLDGLNKFDQYAEISALKTRFATPAAASPTPAAVPILNTGVSKAPPPIKTLSTGATQPPRKSEAELATGSAEDYQKAHPEIKVYRGRHGRSA